MIGSTPRPQPEWGTKANQVTPPLIARVGSAAEVAWLKVELSIAQTRIHELEQECDELCRVSTQPGWDVD